MVSRSKKKVRRESERREETKFRTLILLGYGGSFLLKVEQPVDMAIIPAPNFSAGWDPKRSSYDLLNICA